MCTDFVLETLQMAIYSAMTLTILHETCNRLTSYLQKIYFVQVCLKSKVKKLHILITNVRNIIVL